MSPIKQAVSPYLLLAKNIGMELGVPYTLILAIIYRESAGDTWASRYEPYFKYLNNPGYFAQTNHITIETETIQQMTSFGLMQIMGATSRDLGYGDKLTKLCQPSMGIYWGAKYLQKLSKKYPVLHDTIAAYNAGSPKRLESGEYANQAYVNYVVKYMTELINEGI